MGYPIRTVETNIVLIISLYYSKRKGKKKAAQRERQFPDILSNEIVILCINNRLLLNLYISSESQKAV